MGQTDRQTDRHQPDAQTLFASRGQRQQVCVQPRPSAVNMTLPAFTALCRAAAPLLMSAGAYYRSISPARRHSAANPPRAAAVAYR